MNKPTIGQLQLKEATSQEMLLLFIIHEIRTPLTLILCNAQLLQQIFKKEFARLEASGESWFERDLALLSSVVEHADHINTLLTTLIDAARLSAGQCLVTLHERVDIATLLHQCIQQQATGDHELQHQINAHMRFGLGDSTRIAQVMSTLITRAIRDSPPGMPVLIRAVQEDAAQKIVVTVHNEGESISEEEQMDLFNFASGLESCLNTARGLAALELPIAYALVTQQGGEMWVESQPGQGTTFYVSLPLAPL